MSPAPAGPVRPPGERPNWAKDRSRRRGRGHDQVVAAGRVGLRATAPADGGAAGSGPPPGPPSGRRRRPPGARSRPPGRSPSTGLHGPCGPGATGPRTTPGHAPRGVSTRHASSGSQRNARSGGEASAAPLAAGPQDRPASPGRHPLTEAVLPRPTAAVGLIRALHLVLQGPARPGLTPGGGERCARTHWITRDNGRSHEEHARPPEDADGRDRRPGRPGRRSSSR